MSDVGWAFVLAGVVVVGAGVVAWRTGVVRRRPVVWRVPPGSRLAHAFLRPAVRAGQRHAVPVVPLRHCGEWPVDRLRFVPFAARCRPCEYAAERLGQSP